MSTDVVSLTAQLVDIPSESRHEAALATAVVDALADCDHLTIERTGNTVVARTNLGRDSRVVIAGHLDTVPAANNLPHQQDDASIRGLGACDMKGGVAAALRAAWLVRRPIVDVTYVWYDCEEIAAEYNGLAHLVREQPKALDADFAILMEPTNAVVEAGCQGSLRVDVAVPGARAHSARSWMGQNAIHAASAVLDRLNAYVPRRPTVGGLEFREGLNAVAVRGGIAGNVIPDECVVTVNYRFAPDLTVAAAEAHVREVFDDWEVVVADAASAAHPGLDREPVRDFVNRMGGRVVAKLGWTDVARFTELGVPAVNFGPGDPSLAHTPGEYVPTSQLVAVETALLNWLTGASDGEVD